MMTIAEKVRLLTRRRGMSLATLSERTGQTPQNFSAKMRRDNFTVVQMMEIAEVLGCEVEISFIDKETGEKI